MRGCVCDALKCYQSTYMRLNITINTVIDTVDGARTNVLNPSTTNSNTRLSISLLVYERLFDQGEIRYIQNHDGK